MQSSFADRFVKTFQHLLPSPFSIALLLTVVAGILVLIFGSAPNGESATFADVLRYWEKGLWNRGLLVFAFQMMLMLVLGHTLALSPGASGFIQAVSTRLASSLPTAAAGVALLSMLVGFFNWGFGLIFGAILARKVGEAASRNGIAFNYPLIGAAGYSALMVWHGGISGSAPIKVAEAGHLKELLGGVLSPEELAMLPGEVSFSETVFGSMNITAFFLLILLIPSLLFFVAKRVTKQKLRIDGSGVLLEQPEPAAGAERFDQFSWVGIIFGAVMIAAAVLKIAGYRDPGSLRWVDPNWINLLLLGLALIAHRSIQRFLAAIQQAISGAAGILIQFPLYFGIMGLFTSSGLISLFSEWIVSVSNEVTYPLFTFFSAGLVNIFVPSGGGQWAVQGAIIVKAAIDLKVPIAKSVMAMAYGDQITNMLQPFWALPLLGITGLKARDILPYSLLLLAAGSTIFFVVLLLF